MFLCFFFQAEDGIRDYKVTGVQTCALPICIREVDKNHLVFLGGAQWNGNFKVFGPPFDDKLAYTFHQYRSEERRVGKEWRSRMAPAPNKEKTRARKREEQYDGMQSSLESAL